MTSTVSALGTGTTSYSYDANDRLSPDLYDNNGNTTLSGGVSNTYDFENRMTTYGTTTLGYDGDGNRVSESVGGATTKYLVDTLNPTGLPQVLDETVNGSVTRTYAYGLQRISEDQLNGSTWTPSFYGYDGHGNVRFLTNSTGTVTDTYQYDAFGRLIASTGSSTPNNFLYSGEQYDRNLANLGLYNLRARYYNQATGRFWARDPEEGAIDSPVTLNPYIYASDDSVNEIDPTGRSTIAPPAPPPTETETKPAGGAILDYLGVAAAVSLAAIAAIKPLAEEINCVLTMVGSRAAAIVENAADGASKPLTEVEKKGCKYKAKNCKTQFPDLIPVNQLGYRYTSRHDAEDAARAAARPNQIELGANATATGGPCGPNSGYQVGTHQNVYEISKSKGRLGHIGDIVMCPCCDDSSGTPMPTKRWDFI